MLFVGREVKNLIYTRLSSPENKFYPKNKPFVGKLKRILIKRRLMLRACLKQADLETNESEKIKC